jgi:DNA-binding NarL/FixJ family response regulator
MGEMTHGSIKVVIADDHPVVLHGLVTLLSNEQGFIVVAACQNGEAAMQAILKYSPDVALLDLRMPRMTGLDVLNGVQGSNGNTRMIILTAFAEEDDILTAIDRGVHGIVLKDSGPRALIDCLREVCNGSRSLPPELVRRAQNRLAQINSIHQLLTSRERQVMGLVVEGASNKRIAKQLKITAGTVKLHLHHIFCKTGVRNRSALMTLTLGLWPNCEGRTPLSALCSGTRSRIHAEAPTEV